MESIIITRRNKNGLFLKRESQPRPTKCVWYGSSMNFFMVRIYTTPRSSQRMCSVRKGVLRNFSKFTGKHLFKSLFYKKETLAEVFSCKFCEITKNTFFTEHLWVTASQNFPRLIFIPHNKM